MFSQQLTKAAPGCPRLCEAGEEWRVLFGLDGESGSGCGGKACSFRIGIAVVPMDGLAVPMADPFDSTSFRNEIEGAGCPREYAAHVGPAFLPRGTTARAKSPVWEL